MSLYNYVTPKAGVVEAGVVVGDGEQRHAARTPRHRLSQSLAVVHSGLVQELCNHTTQTQFNHIQQTVVK